MLSHNTTDTYCSTVLCIWTHNSDVHSLFFSICFSQLIVSPLLESRPLSIPMKVIPDMAAEESSITSEERMKVLIAHAWDAVKRLTLQVPRDTLHCMITLHNHSVEFLLHDPTLIFFKVTNFTCYCRLIFVHNSRFITFCQKLYNNNVLFPATFLKSTFSEFVKLVSQPVISWIHWEVLLMCVRAHINDTKYSALLFLFHHVVFSTVHS